MTTENTAVFAPIPNPIVSTAIGAEGNDAEPGIHYLAADHPQDFADAVVRLLNDAELRARLSEASLQLAQHTYSLDSVGGKYEAMIELAVQRSKAGGVAA